MHRSTTLLVTLLAALALPSAGAAAGKRPRVAVMDLRSLGIDASTAELLSEMALTEATSIDGVEAIGRSEINAVLGFEKQKQMFGCAEDGSCLAEIAGALGVDYVLIGSVGKIGQLYRIDMKLLEAKKARARDRIGETQSDQEKLLAAVQRGIRRLLSPLAVADAAPAPKPGPTVSAAPAAATFATGPNASESSTPATGFKMNRKSWGAVTAATGVALIATNTLVTGAALRETRYLAKVQLMPYYPCPPYACGTSWETFVTPSISTYRNRMRIADVTGGLGLAAVGTGLWLGLSGDAPPAGEPRRFLALTQRGWGYVLGGAGLVAGGAGLYFNSKARDASHAYDRALVEYDPTVAGINYANATARARAAHEYTQIRNRYYASGAAFLASGLYLWLTGGGHAPPVAIDVVPTSGGAMASLSASW